MAQLAASLGLDGSLRRTRIISQLARSVIPTSSNGQQRGSNEAMSQILDLGSVYRQEGGVFNGPSDAAHANARNGFPTRPGSTQAAARLVHRLAPVRVMLLINTPPGTCGAGDAALA